MEAFFVVNQISFALHRVVLSPSLLFSCLNLLIALSLKENVDDLFRHESSD